MTADPNDDKGPQQIPATDIGAILPSDAGRGPAAQLLLTLAEVWSEASKHRKKGRPEELGDIPPDSMRRMASVLKIYARQLDGAAVVATFPSAVASAVAAEIQTATDAAVTVDAVVADVVANYHDYQVPVATFVPEVMATVPDAFGPPGAYVEDDGPLNTWTIPDFIAFGPPAPYSDDELGPAAWAEATAPPKA